MYHLQNKQILLKKKKLVLYPWSILLKMDLSLKLYRETSTNENGNFQTEAQL
jgi:hypothetical protein